MRHAAGLLLCLCGTAGTTDTALDLTEAERAAFGAELRALLLDEPGIVGAALAPPSPFEEDAAADRALLRRLDPLLFGPDLPGFGPTDAPLRMALLTSPDCPECLRAEAEARALAAAYRLRVTLVDTARAPQVTQALGLDILPAYVIGDVIVRGHVPPAVLERYLARTR